MNRNNNYGSAVSLHLIFIKKTAHRHLLFTFASYDITVKQHPKRRNNMSEEIRNDGIENTAESTAAAETSATSSAEQNAQTSTQQSYTSNPQYGYAPVTDRTANLAQQEQGQYNTGYYTSVHRETPASGSMYSYPQYTNTPNNESYQTNKKKEKKKGHAGLVICCILLSLVCGIAGAFGGLFLYNEYMVEDQPAEDTTPTVNTDGSNTVIFEAVDREIPKEVSEAGTVAAVASIALPSVVEIRTEAVTNNSFYGQYVTEGAGSGVIISEDGYIVTNNHVISGASNINVRLTNGEEYKAKLIGTDAQTDIAVIKIEAEKLTPAVFGDSSTLIIGELTVAIGNPLGELGGTVTDGIISALDREITVEGENMVLLQTNAAVSPGNSGGGLFNSNGELIGVVNAKSSGSSVEGLGFAIPINTAKVIIKDLIEKGYVTGRPSIGITIVEVTTDYQRFMYGVNEYGVYIQKALNEEFKAGDRIIAIDGNSVSTSSDIKSVLSGHSVGDKVTVTVSRKNKIIDVEVTLIDSAENTLSTEG